MNPAPQTSATNLALQNHPARRGEVIKWQGQYWRCVSKHGIYTGFERVADRVREGV